MINSRRFGTAKRLKRYWNLYERLFFIKILLGCGQHSNTKPMGIKSNI